MNKWTVFWSTVLFLAGYVVAGFMAFLMFANQMMEIAVNQGEYALQSFANGVGFVAWIIANLIVWAILHFFDVDGEEIGTACVIALVLTLIF